LIQRWTAAASAVDLRDPAIDWRRDAAVRQHAVATVHVEAHMRPGTDSPVSTKIARSAGPMSFFRRLDRVDEALDHGINDGQVHSPSRHAPISAVDNACTRSVTKNVVVAEDHVDGVPQTFFVILRRIEPGLEFAESAVYPLDGFLSAEDRVGYPRRQHGEANASAPLHHLGYPRSITHIVWQTLHRVSQLRES